MEINALIQLTLMKRWRSGEPHPPDELINCPWKDHGKSGAIPLKKVNNLAVPQNQLSRGKEVICSPSFPKEGEFLLLTFAYWLAGNILEAQEKMLGSYLETVETEEGKTTHHSLKIIFSSKRMPIFLDYLPWNVRLLRLLSLRAQGSYSPYNTSKQWQESHTSEPDDLNTQQAV